MKRMILVFYSFTGMRLLQPEIECIEDQGESSARFYCLATLSFRIDTLKNVYHSITPLLPQNCKQLASPNTLGGFSTPRIVSYTYKGTDVNVLFVIFFTTQKTFSCRIEIKRMTPHPKSDPTSRQDIQHGLVHCVQGPGLR